MIADFLKDLEELYLYSSNTEEYINKTTKIYKDNKELLIKLAELRLPEIVCLVTNLPPTMFSQFEDLFRYIKPYFKRQEIEIENDYNIIENKILPYASQAIINDLEEKYKSKGDKINAKVKKYQKEMETLQKDLDINKMKSKECVTSKGKKSKSKDQTTEIAVGDDSESYTKEKDANAIAENRKELYKTKNKQLKQERSLKIKEAEKKLHEKQNELNELENDRQNVIRIKDLLKTSKINYKEQYENKLKQAERINIEIKGTTKDLFIKDYEYQNLVNLYVNNSVSKSSNDDYWHLKETASTTDKICDILMKSESKSSAKAFLELAQDGFVVLSGNNINVQKFIQKTLMECVKRLKRQSELESDTLVLSVFYKLIDISIYENSNYRFSQDPEFWDNVDDDYVLEIILTYLNECLEQTKMFNELINIFDIAESSSNQGLMKNLIKCIVEISLKEGVKPQFDAAFFCDWVYRQTNFKRIAKALLNEIIEKNIALTKDLQRQKAILEYRESKASKELLKVLYEPINKLEKTTTNFVVSNESAKTAAKYIMKEIVQLRNALKQVGILPVADINDWLNQKPVKFNPESHDSPNNTETNELVRLRTIGLKSGDVIHYALVDQRIGNEKEKIK